MQTKRIGGEIYLDTIDQVGNPVRIWVGSVIQVTLNRKRWEEGNFKPPRRRTYGGSSYVREAIAY